MKKNFLFTLLAASMSLMSFAGCANDNTVTGDTVDVVEETMTEAKEYYVTLDAYGPANGMLRSKYEEGDPLETQSWEMEIEEGKTVAELIEAQGASGLELFIWESEEPVDDIFEGWIEYTYEIIEDEEGFTTNVYTRVTGDTYLTTEEVLAKEMTAQCVAYVAKWADVTDEEYFLQYEYVDDGLELSLSMYANEGTFYFGGDEPYEADFSYATIESGLRLGAFMNGTLESVEHDDYDFAGWELYTAETVEWVDEEVTDLTENDICIEMGSYGYAVLYNYTVSEELVSTEELAEIECEGMNYVVIAKWE